jgi:hypothetical protein
MVSLLRRPQSVNKNVAFSESICCWSEGKEILQDIRPKEVKKIGLNIFFLASRETDFVHHSIILYYSKDTAEFCNLSFGDKPFISSIVFSLMDCFGLSLYGTIITVVWSGHPKPQGLTHPDESEIQSLLHTGS